MSKSSVKTIITDALDISAEDYKNITLTPIDSTAPSVIPVFYNDDNGYQKYYELKMENSYKYVYDIQNYQRRIDETVIEADFDNVYDTCKKTLNYAKDNITSKAKVKGNKIMKKTHSSRIYKEIRK